MASLFTQDSHNCSESFRQGDGGRELGGGGGGGVYKVRDGAVRGREREGGKRDNTLNRMS